jgi:hypothetical protein
MDKKLLKIQIQTSFRSTNPSLQGIPMGLAGLAERKRSLDI